MIGIPAIGVRAGKILLRKQCWQKCGI